MKEFKHLDFPRLREYYTKYPQGYTLYESILDILEHTNALTDVVNLTLNQWEQIETWVLNELKNYSIDQLQTWLDDGILEEVINTALIESKADKAFVQERLDDFALNIKDYESLKIGNDWASAFQQALDDLYDNQGGVLYVPTGEYEISQPLLVKSVASVGGYDQPTVRIVGESFGNTVINKTVPNTYRDIDATLILIKGSTLNLSDSYSGIEISHLKLKNSSVSATETHVLYGARGSRLICEHVSFENLKGGQYYGVSVDDIWSSKFDTCMFTADYGLTNTKGTSLTLLNNCAFTSKVAYQLGVTYSTMIDSFVEGSSGIGLKVVAGHLHITSIGMESPDLTTNIVVENNVHVTIDSANLWRPTADQGVVFDIGNGSSIVVRLCRMVMGSTDVGYLFKILYNSHLGIDDLLFTGSGRFLYSEMFTLPSKFSSVRVNRKDQMATHPSTNQLTSTGNTSVIDWYLKNPTYQQSQIYTGLKDIALANDGTDLTGQSSMSTPNSIYLNSDFTTFKVLGWVRETHQGGQIQQAIFKYIPLILSGVTGSRPSKKVAGMSYFDTTLNKPIWWNGSEWVDATGTTV